MPQFIIEGGVVGEITLGETEDLTGSPGPAYVVSSGIRRVRYLNNDAVSIFTWPNVTTLDDVTITFSGDKDVAPTNPATRRVAIDITGPNTVEAYVSGATGELVTLDLTRVV